MGSQKKERISERGGRDLSGLVDRAWNRFQLRVDKAGVREARKGREMQDLRRENNIQEGELSP